MKKVKKPSGRESDSGIDIRLEGKYLVQLKSVGLRPEDYAKEEHESNLRAYQAELNSGVLGQHDRIGKMKDGVLDHIVTANGATRPATEEEKRQVAAELAKIESRYPRPNPIDAHPFPVPTPPVESGPLFETTAELLDWWPDKALRQLATKRLADEAADLKGLLAAGRKNVVLFRRVCVWGWLVKQALVSLGAPFARLIVKAPSLIWMFLVWLVSKP